MPRKVLAFGTTISRFKISNIEARYALVAYLQRESTKSTSMTRRKSSKYDKSKDKLRIKKRPRIVSPWSRKAETEDYSKFLGYKMNVQHVLKEKQFDKTLRGPGAYNVKTSSLKKGNMSKGKVFTTSKRWDPAQKSQAPPPGAHNPNAFKELSTQKRNATRVPLFERDGMRDRFKPDRSQIFKVPPNVYHPKDPGSMEEKCNRVVSIRGPYDCFTGPRDITTIKNHFGALKQQTNDKLFKPAVAMDYLLTDPRKKRCGVVYHEPYIQHPSPCWKRHKHNDYCYVLPDTPGPASYDIRDHMIKPVQNSMYPFGSSVPCPREVVKQNTSPGPGRYFCHDLKSLLKPKHSTIFHSKVLARLMALKKLTQSYSAAKDSVTVASMSRGSNPSASIPRSSIPRVSFPRASIPRASIPRASIPRTSIPRQSSVSARGY